MAGKKKKKKNSGRETPGSGSNMSHIASHLISSTLFAAVPRTPSGLSQHWPRRTPSPIASAIGEIGNVGRAVGASNISLSSRAPADLPEDTEKPPVSSATNDQNGNGRDEVEPPSEFSEPGYETVKTNRDTFDKTTKYYRMQKEGLLDSRGGEKLATVPQERGDFEGRDSSGHGSDNALYHVLDHEKKEVIEPTYSRVDKKRIGVPSPDKNAGGGGSDEIFSDDLTDVTSNDESSVSTRVKSRRSLDFKGRRRSQKGSERGDSRQNRRAGGRIDGSGSEEEDAADGPTLSGRSSRTPRTSQVVGEHSGDESEVSHKELSSEAPPVPPYQEGAYPVEGPSGGPRRLSKSRLSPFEGQGEDASGRPQSDNARRSSKPQGALDESQLKALSDFERLAAETFKEKEADTSDGSDDNSSYLLPTVPTNTTDFHGRTRFEREQFSETFFEEDFARLEDDARRVSRGNRVLVAEAMAENLQAGAPDEQPIRAESEGFLRSRPHFQEGADSQPQARHDSQRQKRIEELALQQEKVYRQQMEQQTSQRHQQQELIKQQWQLQEQLRALEKMQKDWQQVATDQAGGRSPREVDARLQKELIQQQQEMLRRQQEQQKQYQQQQGQLLRQQETLLNEIKQLEHHQQELKSHVSGLSPRASLEEMRRTEQDIVSLLREQKEQQSQYEQLYREQQRQAQEQAGRFTAEKQLMREEQQELTRKIKEQQERSRTLEKELEELSRKEVSTKQKRSPSMESTGSQQQRDQDRDRGHKDGRTAGTARAESSRSERRSLRDAALSQAGRGGSGSRGDKLARVAIEARQRSKEELHQLSRPRIELLESEKAALMELNASLQGENTYMKQLARSLQKGTGSASVVLQHQVKDLQLDNKVLRDTVHRLNIELSRFQAKYRPVSFEEVEGLALSPGEEAPSWLVNTKYLSPLFMAYDDQLKEKEKIIQAYDDELNAFKSRVMEIVKENQQLHMSISKVKPDVLGPDEWQQLQEQAKLVVDENAVLMEQQEVQEKKAKDQQRVHAQEVSKLSRRIARLESDKRRLDTDCDDLRRTHSKLVKTYEALVAEDEHKIPLKDHMAMMDECRRILEDVKLNSNTRAAENDAQLEALKKEKSSLAVRVADAEARSTQMNRELEAYKKAQGKSERKLLFLQRQLEHVQDREQNAQETLSEVLKVAEKTAEERDSVVHFAKSQKKEQKFAASQIKMGNESIRGLQEKLEENKSRANERIAVATARLKEKEKEITKLRETHERELNSLRALVREKQRQLENVLGENRHVDKELELVWKAATADNKRMKSTARNKGAMFDSDSDPNGQVSSEEEGRR